MRCGTRCAAGCADFVTLLVVGVPTLLALLPQFLGVLQQAEIIAGHEFVTHQGKKRALFDAIVQHTRHLNDYPIQNILIALGAAGGLILLIRRDLVAGGGLAAAGGRDRAFVGAVRRTGRHRHRQVQRPVLQRPAPALGGRHHADHPDGRDRVVHGGGAGGGGCPVADPPGGRPRSRPRFLDRGDGGAAGRRHRRAGLALLPAAPASDRREVRPGDRSTTRTSTRSPTWPPCPVPETR